MPHNPKNDCTKDDIPIPPAPIPGIGISTK